MLRRAAIVATLLGVAAILACGRSPEAAPETLTVAGERVAVAPLVDAHDGLCQAAAQPSAARRLFFDRSHDALHTVARALEDVDRAQAGDLLQAKENVESALADPPPNLPENLIRLADVYRAALGRLAITAPPCEK